MSTRPELGAHLQSTLQDNPNDIPARLRFAIYLYHEQDSYDGSMEELEKVLALHPNQPEAVLMMAMIQGIEFGDMLEVTYQMLQKVGEDDPEVASMKYFMMAYYDPCPNELEYEEKLKRSIECCDKHVKNLQCLAALYEKKSLVDQAARYYEAAERNVVKLLRSEDPYDPSDYQAFLNEMIKGTLRPPRRALG